MRALFTEFNTTPHLTDNASKARNTTSRLVLEPQIFREQLQTDIMRQSQTENKPEESDADSIVEILPIKKNVAVVWFFVDALVALLITWGMQYGLSVLYPDEVNPIENITIAALVFVSTTLIMFGVQLIGWMSSGLRSQINAISKLNADMVSDIENKIQTSLIEGSDTALVYSLMKKSSVDPTYTKSMLNIIKTLYAIDTQAPNHTRPAFETLAINSLQDLGKTVSNMSSVGLSLSQNKQVDLIQAYLDVSNSFIIIDQTIYANIMEDWTPRFLNLLMNIKSRNNLQKIYYVPLFDWKVAGALPKGASELREQLEACDWDVRFVDGARILDDDPDFACFNGQLTEIFDNRYQISMETVANFTSDKLVTTKISGVDQLTHSYIEALNRSILFKDKG